MEAQQNAAQKQLIEFERSMGKSRDKTVLLQRQIEQARCDLAKAICVRDSARAQLATLQEEVKIEADAALATQKIVEAAERTIHAREVLFTGNLFLS